MVSTAKGREVVRHYIICVAGLLPHIEGEQLARHEMPIPKVNVAMRRIRRAATAVCPDSGADRPLVPDLCLGLRLGRSDNRVRKPSPCVRGAQRGAISRSTWGRRAGCGDSRAWSNAVRSSSGWVIRCSGPFAGVRWA
jgi:hypothetical protein